MTLTIDIDDTLVPSLNQFLSTQRTAKIDEVTGATYVEPNYADVEDFVLQHIGNLIHQIVLQYPPPELRAKMAQAKALQEEVKAAARPKKSQA